MNQPLRPKSPIPPQLRVSDEGSFAHYTFTHRIPAIIQQVIAENNFNSLVINKLEALAQNLPHEKVRPLHNDGGADLAAWAKYIQPYQAKYWLDCPFYFIETYFYRRLLETTAYFSVREFRRLDPFERQKRLDLAKSMKFVRLKVSKHENFYNFKLQRNIHWQQTLLDLLYLNLWSNRVDLSLNPAKAGSFNHEQNQMQQSEDCMILNDASKVINYLRQGKKSRVDFVIDNAGWELISDLLLADFLLTSNAVAVVYLHLKIYPVFVSDAMIKDVRQAIDLLANDRDATVRELAVRLRTYIVFGRLKLADNYFWNAPLFFWSMPPELRQDLAQSSLVLIKGDANYRRLVGDCRWAKTASFTDICCYFPAPLVTLRTLKSEVIVGLKANQIAQLNREDPQWLTNGTRGLIQFLKLPQYSDR